METKKIKHNLKLSFDGHGFNDKNSEYRERIATLSNYGKALEKEKLQFIARAVNAHEELVDALTQTLNALYNETSFKTDTPWILETKEKALNALKKAEG